MYGAPSHALAVILAVVALLVVVVVLLNRRSQPDQQENAKAPTEQIMTADSVDTKPTEEESYTGSDTLAPQDTSSVRTEEKKEIPAEVKKDSTTVTPTDSAATALPDSTRKQ